MKNNIILIIVAIVIFLNKFGLPNIDIDVDSKIQASETEIYRAESYLAYRLADDNPTVTPDDTVIENCGCNGTKKISRDGRVYTECDCIKNKGVCNCQKEQGELFTEAKKEDGALKVKNNRILLFTVESGCIPCKELQNSTLVEDLTKAGWSVGNTDKDHLQILKSESLSNINVTIDGRHPSFFPAFVKVRNGVIDWSTASSANGLITYQDGRLDYAKFTTYCQDK